MISGFLLSLLIAGAPGAEARVHRIPPVDRCASDASFAAFRAELRQALSRKDRDRILAIVAEDIQVDFGGGEGRARFVEAWALDRPETSLLWHELDEVLSLGCVPDEHGIFWAPSPFLADDHDDPFTTALAIHSGAGLHAAPDPSSPIVATLEWDLLTVPEWDWEEDWQRAELADGRSGFVRSADIRSPVDYRAGFRRVDGRWRMSVFIAGD